MATCLSPFGKKSMTVYGLETELKFGAKHRGETIEEIIEDDPDYLLWAIDTIEWFELDDEAEEELERRITKDR